MGPESYDKYLVSIVRKGFIFCMTREKYTDKKTRKMEEYNILAHLNKGLLLTAESSQKKVGISKLYFEINTTVNGKAPSVREADSLMDMMLLYDNTPQYDSLGKEIGRLFRCDMTKNNIETVLKNLEDSYIKPNNPWKFFDAKNIYLLKSSDSEKNIEKTNLAKIKRFANRVQDMIGYIPARRRDPELFE